MKCNAWVSWYINKKGVRTRRKDGWIPKYRGHRGTLEENKLEDLRSRYVGDDWEECDGHITATVEAVDDPYMGGSRAKLKVNYKCDKCGCTFFQSLPDEYTISEWLTKYVESIPSVEKIPNLEKV